MNNSPENRRAPTINRQQDIYSKGLSGEKPLVPVDFQELERKGCDAISPAAPWTASALVKPWRPCRNLSPFIPNPR